MAWENRMALDMMLAEKGGVCAIVGGNCRTFIPNNTAPNGTITKALQGLTALFQKLEKNSSINNPLIEWLENWFEKWKGIATSILIFLIIPAKMFITAGCYIIPCAQRLVQKPIKTTRIKNKKDPYDEECEKALSKFENLKSEN